MLSVKEGAILFEFLPGAETGWKTKQACQTANDHQVLLWVQILLVIDNLSESEMSQIGQSWVKLGGTKSHPWGVPVESSGLMDQIKWLDSPRQTPNPPFCPTPFATISIQAAQEVTWSLTFLSSNFTNLQIISMPKGPCIYNIQIWFRSGVLPFLMSFLLP